MCPSKFYFNGYCSITLKLVFILVFSEIADISTFCCILFNSFYIKFCYFLEYVQQ